MSRGRRSPRWRLNLPLSRQDSKHVEHCYASHGKGFAKLPAAGSEILVIAINLQRHTRWIPGRVVYDPEQGRDVMKLDQPANGWLMLGWVMTDGSLPLGELDAVDPEMTWLGNLGPVEPPGHYGNMMAGLIPLLESDDS